MHIFAFLWLLLKKLQPLSEVLALFVISRAQNAVRILKQYCRILLVGQLVIVFLLTLVVQKELLDFWLWNVWVKLIWELDYFEPALLITYELQVSYAKQFFHGVLLLTFEIFSNTTHQAYAFFSVGLEVSMAHGLFYKINYFWHLICLKNPAWHYLQKRQSESIKKCPAIFKKHIEKMVHLGRRNYICVKGKNPVGSVQLYS